MKKNITALAVLLLFCTISCKKYEEKEFWLEEKDKDNDGTPDEEVRLVPFE